MTDHYLEAESSLEAGNKCGDWGDPENWIADAQVRATLALVDQQKVTNKMLITLQATMAAGLSASQSNNLLIALKNSDVLK